MRTHPALLGVGFGLTVLSLLLCLLLMTLPRKATSDRAGVRRVACVALVLAASCAALWYFGRKHISTL